jgi:Zn-dependent oligopeptidase
VEPEATRAIYDEWATASRRKQQEAAEEEQRQQQEAVDRAQETYKALRGAAKVRGGMQKKIADNRRSIRRQAEDIVREMQRLIEQLDEGRELYSTVPVQYRGATLDALHAETYQLEHLVQVFRWNGAADLMDELFPGAVSSL